MSRMFLPFFSSSPEDLEFRQAITTTTANDCVCWRKEWEAVTQAVLQSLFLFWRREKELKAVFMTLMIVKMTEDFSSEQSEKKRMNFVASSYSFFSFYFFFLEATDWCLMRCLLFHLQNHEYTETYCPHTRYTISYFHSFLSLSSIRVSCLASQYFSQHIFSLGL